MTGLGGTGSRLGGDPASTLVTDPTTRPVPPLRYDGAPLTASLLTAAVWRLVRSVPQYPCNEVSGSPPKSDPQPTIGGDVVDAGNGNSPVSGASMRLYRCGQSPQPTLVDTVTTNSSGQYLFATVEPGFYYYVEAVMSGPLSGMTPASGTENPSNAVGIGDSVSDLDFAFE